LRGHVKDRPGVARGVFESLGVANIGACEADQFRMARLQPGEIGFDAGPCEAIINMKRISVPRVAICDVSADKSGAAGDKHRLLK
jgi:hypothetical protein